MTWERGAKSGEMVVGSLVFSYTVYMFAWEGMNVGIEYEANFMFAVRCH